jgi:hypothetical protein
VKQLLDAAKRGDVDAVRTMLSLPEAPPVDARDAHAPDEGGQAG